MASVRSRCLAIDQPLYHTAPPAPNQRARMLLRQAVLCTVACISLALLLGVCKAATTWRVLKTAHPSAWLPVSLSEAPGHVRAKRPAMPGHQSSYKAVHAGIGLRPPASSLMSTFPIHSTCAAVPSGMSPARVLRLPFVTCRVHCLPLR